MASRFLRSELIAVLFALWAPAMVHGAATGVAWRTDLDAAKIEAAQSGRMLLLHFYTQTCSPCKVLDATVLSQPQVGAAVEQNYVPVKIDAEASEAIARMFRIERVPTEVVLTPEGKIVAVLSTPGTPEAYVEQLQNLAAHVRSQTPNSGSSAPPAQVNSAYASLPAGASAAANRSASAPVVPQQQSNPYVAAPSAAQVAGAASPITSPPAGNPSLAATTTDANAVTAAPQMPTNAMPQSYRGAVASAPPAAAWETAGSDIAAPPSTAAAAGVASVAGPPAPAGAQRAQQLALPANSPPVAFDGYCPVSLKMKNEWVLGNTQFGAKHRGRTYLFASEPLRQQFLADPDAYSPVFAGYDPVLLLDKQQSVQGSRRYGFRYSGAFYLFSTPETMARFKASPQTYAAGVRQAMARIDGAAGGTILR